MGRAGKAQQPAPKGGGHAQVAVGGVGPALAGAGFAQGLGVGVEPCADVVHLQPVQRRPAVVAQGVEVLEHLVFIKRGDGFGAEVFAVRFEGFDPADGLGLAEAFALAVGGFAGEEGEHFMFGPVDAALGARGRHAGGVTPGQFKGARAHFAVLAAARGDPGLGVVGAGHGLSVPPGAAVGDHAGHAAAVGHVVRLPEALAGKVGHGVTHGAEVLFRIPGQLGGLVAKKRDPAKGGRWFGGH